MKRILLFALILAGCANQPGQPPRSQQTSAEPPVSQQTPLGDAGARAKSHTDLGMAYFQGGQIGIAMDEARLAIAADSNYAPAYNLLGLSHMYLQENPQAQSNFERALRLAPNDSEINNNYGSFLCQTGRDKDAMQHFMTAVKNPLYATPTIPYTNAGRCALQSKDDRAAEGYFRKALMADGRNVLAIYELADIYYRRGNYYDAQRFIAEVHRAGDPNATTLWLALRIERKLGNREAEANFASQLRRKFAGTPEYQALMQGKYE